MSSDDVIVSLTRIIYDMTMEEITMTGVIINGCHGRMGKALMELIADIEDVKIVAGVDPYQPEGVDLGYPVYSTLGEVKESADSVIDFSNAEGIPALLSDAVSQNLPIVIATTGLSDEVQAKVVEASKKIAVFQSANMSLGINLLRDLIKKAASILGEGFDVEIIEKHHKMKKDAPSGTAFLLADALKEDRDYDYVYGRRETAQARKPRELGIHAVRGGTIVGEHEVIFTGPEEVIEIGHKAYSRKVFATGAIKAAQFIAAKGPGIYSMSDVVGL